MQNNFPSFAVKKHFINLHVYLILLTLILSGMKLQAQDIIIKNDKSEIKSKVIEISETTIKYKKFEKASGPIYSINTTDVFMIIYADGTRELIQAAQPVIPSSSASNSTPQSTQNSKVEAAKTIVSNSIEDEYTFNVKDRKKMRDKSLSRKERNNTGDLFLSSGLVLYKGLNDVPPIFIHIENFKTKCISFNAILDMSFTNIENMSAALGYSYYFNQALKISKYKGGLYAGANLYLTHLVINATKMALDEPTSFGNSVGIKLGGRYLFAKKVGILGELDLFLNGQAQFKIGLSGFKFRK